MIRVRVSDQGFSLVEVIVAMGILSLLVLAVYSMITTSIVGRRKAELRQEALYAAKGLMEYAVASGVEPGSNGPMLLRLSLEDLFSGMDRDDRFETDIEIEEYDQMPGLYSVTIAIVWPEEYLGGGRVELWSLVGEKDGSAT